MTSAAVPTPVTAVHQGIEYPGEYLRIPVWQPSLGEPLTKDVYFRVVFLERESPVFPQSIHDHRTAVYVPGGRTPELERAEVELRVLREAMATYAAASESQDVLTSESRAAEDRAVEAWAASFRGGHLIAAPPLDADLGLLFGDGFWSSWAERIGLLLLRRAYVETLLSVERLKAPISPETDAPILFDALAGVRDTTADFALNAFGPALGLSGRPLGATPNEVHQRLEAMVSDGWPPGDVGHALAHEHGLTYPLATLYLLCWVRDGHRSLRLRPGHGLLQRDGERFPSDTIRPEDIGSLRWPIELWPRLQGIDLPGPPTQTDSHLAALAGPLGPTESMEQAAERRLADLRDGLPTVLLSVGRLAIAQGNHSLPDELASLQAIAEAGPLATALDEAKRTLPEARSLAQVLQLWRGWSAYQEQADRLTHATDWLRAAVVDESAGELFTEREGLVSRVHAPALLTAPHEWAGLAESVRLFQERYTRSYLAYHQRHHAEIERLAHTLEATWLEAKALDRLNQIAELGPPVGEGLLPLVEELRNAMIACGAERPIDDVLQTPLCPTCAMHLGAPVPALEVEQAVAYVNGALGEQNRRLATYVAHRLIRRPDHEKLDRFVEVVQISDLGGLANILDDELVNFISELLNEEEASGG